MALNETTLKELCTTGYGPITLEESDAGYAAHLGGRTAAVSLDPGTVRVRVVLDMAWPTGSDVAEIDRQIGNALTQISASAAGLAWVEGARGRGVTVSAWVDAAVSGAMELASAVKAVIVMAELVIDEVAEIAGALGSDVVPTPAVAPAQQPRVAPAPIVTPAPIAPPTAQPVAPVATAAMMPVATPAPVQSVPAVAAQQWVATHRVPAEGLRAWATPDAAAAPTTTLAAGVELRVDERKGAWVRVSGSNGWSGWVDGRILGA